MTVQEMQALRDRGWTIRRVAEAAGVGIGRVAKVTRRGGRVPSGNARLYEWLYDQYETVSAKDVAAFLECGVPAARKRLERLRQFRLALRVGIEAWVAMDIPKQEAA